jgi:hypothetical protein
LLWSSAVLSWFGGGLGGGVGDLSADIAKFLEYSGLKQKELEMK